jgi:hypothetical protein
MISSWSACFDATLVTVLFVGVVIAYQAFPALMLFAAAFAASRWASQ